MRGDPVYARVLGETRQTPGPRQAIIRRLGKELGRCVASFFTSFRYPVMIDDTSAQMLEDVLRGCSLSNGLALVINSPGGDALAAERIINICRAHSGHNFEAIVPRMAKSAAPMICFGANKIRMLPTAELGAIDPQVVETVEGAPTLMSAGTVIRSYTELLERALGTPAEFVSPLLQQLLRYDARAIAEMENAVELSRDIAVRALAAGMMKGKPEADIAEKIRRFTEPEPGGAHGRSIGIQDSQNCGLVVEEIGLGSKVADMVWELYVRTNHYVSTECSAAIETMEESLSAAPPSPRGEEAHRGE